MLFSGGHFGSQFLLRLLFGLPGLLLAVVLHEYAHAWTAARLGDPTPAADGRLTVRPLAHIDWIGALMLVVAGFGWARPVQVNPGYFKDPRRGMLLTALAGPAMNFLLAVVLMWFYVRLVPDTSLNAYLALIFWLAVVYNVALGLFNLIPIPPLDGSKILGALLPPGLAWRYHQLEPYGWVILILLVVSGYTSWLVGLESGVLHFIEGLVA